jgi:hypothetical protein
MAKNTGKGYRRGAVKGRSEFSHRPLGQPRLEFLVGGIADPQSQQHALVAGLVQSFVAGEQHFADAIKRSEKVSP